MTQNSEPIAITGVGALFPDAKDAAQFWRNIITGRDLITDIPAGHWLIDDYYDKNPTAEDKTYCKRGAFLPDIEFNPIEFGVPPNVVPATDTSQLLALVVAKQVLNDTYGDKFQQADLSRVSVILGAAALEALQYVAARMQRPVWTKAMRELGLPENLVQQACDRIAASYTPWQENTFPGLLGNVVAGRIANRFNLGGTNCITDAACASSLSAIAMAVNELRLQKADMVITGGVDTLNDIVMFMCFSKTQALSFSGNCSPFSSKSDGTMLGEGLGMFALKRLSDAEAQGNKIYGLIRGIGSSSDGRSKSIYAPLAQGQTRAILSAYQEAGYSPGTVTLIEAHGTGTRAGDMAEFKGLTQAFAADGKARPQSVALGSVKSQIGHTKSAAGAAGMFKAIMALRHKILPPTINVVEPNPELHIQDTPFYLNTQLRPWIKLNQQPRRAGLSSFGFGGTNFHIALEEYNGVTKAKRIRAMPTEMVLLTAESPEALLQNAQSLLQENPTHLDLNNLAYTSQQKADPSLLARLAIVASSVEDFLQKIKQAVTAIQPQPEKSQSLPGGIYYGYGLEAAKVAFLFPGQGSQYLGMGGDLAMAFDQAIHTWDVAAEIGDKQLRLPEVVFPVPSFSEEEKKKSAQRLMATQWAQPALAVTSLVLLQLLRTVKIAPDFTAGHSFGELVALHAAGAMDEKTLLHAAQQRGQLMHAAAAANPGAMLSVRHPVAQTLALLQKAHLEVVPANFNSPDQVILSGSKQAIDEAEQYLQQQQISCQRLPVAAGFHTGLLQSACKPFREFLQRLAWEAPKIPVFANTTAKAYPTATKSIPDFLADQLIMPVRFQEMIENMYQDGARTFIEVGAHAVLTGLVKQCLGEREFHAIALDHKGEHGITSLWNSLANLWVLGLNPDFTALWQEYNIPQPLKLKAAGDFTMKINGTNYGRPYPPPGGTPDLPPPNIAPSVAPEAATMTEAYPATAFVPDQGAEERNIQQTSTKLISEETSTYSDLNYIDESNMPHDNPYLAQMYQDLQKQLIEAHIAYQKIMAETHIAFLNSISNLANHAASGNPPETMQQPHPAPERRVEPQMAMETRTAAPQAQPAAPKPAAFTPMAAPKPPTPPPAPVVSQPPPAPPTPAPVASRPPVPPAPSPVKEQPVAATTASPAGSDLQDLLIQIVVEKTGYPKEMLNMDMAIEADLGIDSIKRVEIFSALAERAPHLPEINPSELAEFHTLGDVIAYMKRHIK